MAIGVEICRKSSMSDVPNLADGGSLSVPTFFALFDPIPDKLRMLRNVAYPKCGKGLGSHPLTGMADHVTGFRWIYRLPPGFLEHRGMRSLISSPNRKCAKVPKKTMRHSEFQERKARKG